MADLVARALEEVAPADGHDEDVGDDEPERRDHRPARQRGDLPPGLAEVDLAQEEPEERAGRGRADADADEVPAPLAHVAGKYARWSGTADEAGTALLGEARGRDRPRRLRALPAGQPPQARCGGRLQAAKNAERVVALERRLGIHVEPGLQELLLPHRRLLGVLNVAYVVSNAALTVGWLMRLYAPAPPEFHRFRRAAVLTTLACQPVFYFFPCAPPRSLDHFVDTIADVSGFDLDSGAVAQLYDPLAAMPSIHVAYAVVTAAGIAAASESPCSGRWRRPIRRSWRRSSS